MTIERDAAGDCAALRERIAGAIFNRREQAARSFSKWTDDNIAEWRREAIYDQADAVLAVLDQPERGVTFLLDTFHEVIANALRYAEASDGHAIIVLRDTLAWLDGLPHFQPPQIARCNCGHDFPYEGTNPHLPGCPRAAPNARGES